MVRCLAEKEMISLRSSGGITEFVIDEVMGVGGSCIAYRVSYKENGDILHRGILKEFYPSFLITEATYRRSGAAVCVPEEFAARFSEERESFKNSYRVINEYLSDNVSAVNYHTVQLGLYEGNNTVYTLTSCDYGKRYDKLEDADAHSLFKLMAALTKAVELYHRAGFLHLDIKPANMLVLDGVTDIVKLFDFGSLVPLQDFLDQTAKSVPMPGEYYVPELFDCNIRKIGIPTDIFEIGAVIFKRLFGRYPEPSDMEYNRIYPLEQVPLLAGVSPQARHEIHELLRKTIQISIGRRYQTTAELKKQLDNIVKIIGSDAPYPTDLPKWQPTKNFIGRSADIKELDRRLQENGYAFVKGIGGLGKSELVKYYVKTYASRYHTVQFCKYEDSLKSVVASLSVNGVDDSRFSSTDELIRHKNQILHTCDEHTLLIVDNFNVTHDKFLRDFLPSDNTSFKVIFTTRCQLAADYYADKIQELSKLSMEECKKLYSAHAGCDADNEYVEAIIEKIDYNTLVLVLLAQTVRKTGKTPQEIVSLLDNQELDREQTLLFHEYDYSDEEIEEYNKIYAHLNVIFDISRMSLTEKQLLKNMSLISQCGIRPGNFLEYCACDRFTMGDIDRLVDTGWLEYRDDVLVMHPIVSDLLFMNETIQAEESYYALADHLEDECVPDYNSHIRVVMDRLTCALHLDRRYKNEEEERRILIKTKLGQLYANIYRPKQAREALQEAIELATASEDMGYLSYIYSIAGDVEKEFGTVSTAIDYYERAIEASEESEYDCSDVALEATISVAVCLKENGDLTGAKDVYEEALYFAQEDDEPNACVYGIAQELAKICEQLELPDERDTYTQIMQEHRQFAQEFDNVPQKIKEMQRLTDEGDFFGSLRKYESFLEEKREELGEDSPIYQNTARERWVFYAIHNEREQAMRLATQDLAFIEEKYGAQSMEMAEQLGMIARIFPKIHEFAYAIDCAQRAIDICNTLEQGQGKIALEAKLALANCYLLLGKPDEAKSAYADVDFSVFSGTEILSEIVIVAGQILCELSEYDIAETMCKDLLKRGTVDRFSKVQTYIIYACCREQKGDLDKAEELCENAKPLIESIVDESIKQEWLIQYYRVCARLEYRRGRFQSAVDKLTELLSRFPQERQDAFFLAQLITERGLYNACNKDMESALRDYQHAERILVANELPGESFILLYNNISVHFSDLKNFEKAGEYLDKIVAVKPSVLEPSSYAEAMICGNIGWVAYNNGDTEKAENMLCKAAKALEKIGATNAIDYLTVLHNTALVYEKQERYTKCHDVYRRVLELYDEKTMDAEGCSRRLFATCYIRTLLEDGNAEAAMEFTTQEDRCNVRRFGENGVQRIDFLLQAGSCFKGCGLDFCVDLFKMVQGAVENGGHQNTIHNARLLNYIGVCAADFYEDFEFAVRAFEDAKELFEGLGETQDEAYPVVLSNIEYAREKYMDELIRNMADAIRAEHPEETE